MNGFQWVLNHGVVNTLVELTADGRLTPSLAVDWDRSADASRWSFQLRKGVEFHNGRSLTVQDVIASINYHRAAESKSSVKLLVAPI